MCLLDEVLSWDTERISCRSTSHRDAENPLRARGRLGIACGVEYAAQVMGVHGALIAAQMPAPASGVPAAGYLASVRGVRLYVVRLDDVRGDLICDAVRVAGDRGTALYEFELSSGVMRLLTGRASVILDANDRRPL
jgi:predicted hotdog family 3-hydroxylacyl-ACP dehydratase